MAITGAQQSASAAAQQVDFPKYIGVATCKIMAVNPNNAVLKTLGWNIKDDAEEPSYVSDRQMEDGTIKRTTKVRFMVKILDLDDTPIIPLDFFIGPEVIRSRDGRVKVIDRFGRDAWADEDVVRAKSPIMYLSKSTGQPFHAIIDDKYEVCHRGEQELVKFLMRFLAMKPLEFKDKKTGEWKKNPDAGSLTIDDWRKLVAGNFVEIREYVRSQKDNLIKIVLGTESNGDRIYQSFWKEKFLSPAQFDTAGIYTSISADIKKYMEERPNYVFSDKIVFKSQVTPTEVKMPERMESDTYTPPQEADSLNPDDDDLPF